MDAQSRGDRFPGRLVEGLSVQPSLREGAERYAASLGVYVSACDQIGRYLVEPALRVDLAAERFGLLSSSRIAISGLPSTRVALSLVLHVSHLLLTSRSGGGCRVVDPRSSRPSRSASGHSVRTDLSTVIAGPKLLLDPAKEIGGSIPNMAPDPNAGRAFAVVTPLVEGGDGDAEVFGDFFDGEESVVGVHGWNRGERPSPWTNRPSNPVKPRISVWPGQPLFCDFSDFFSLTPPTVAVVGVGETAG